MLLKSKPKKGFHGDKILVVCIALSCTALFTSFLMAQPSKRISISVSAPPSVAALVDFEVESRKSILPNRFQVRLQRKENLALLFERLQLDKGDLASLLSSLSSNQRRQFNRLAIGTRIIITINEDEALKELVLMNSATKGTRYYLNNNGKYAVGKYEAEYYKEYKHVSGSITSSLYADGLRKGMTDRMVLNFAEIFAYDIDFANDVRVNDEFSLVLEELIVENRSVKQDTIALAEFVNRGETITAIRYTNRLGATGYFTPKGEAMQSRFLRMPINFARVSSRFNPRRRHPVLNIVRPHNGVDFAARSGTPIITTGNGRVTFVGTKSGYGRTIIINHGDGYSTLYGHMRGFVRGMKRNKLVKQGDIIGYVGTTGISTGPHLHYEFRINGKHRDPLRVKFTRSTKLKKSELPRFLSHAETILKKHRTQKEALLVSQ